jgi:hypothetical protein
MKDIHGVMNGFTVWGAVLMPYTGHSEWTLKPVFQSHPEHLGFVEFFVGCLEAFSLDFLPDTILVENLAGRTDIAGTGCNVDFEKIF